MVTTTFPLQNRPSRKSTLNTTGVLNGIDRLIDRYPQAIEWLKTNALLILILIAMMLVPQAAAASYEVMR